MPTPIINRMIYACESVSIGKPSTASGVAIHGVQSFGMTTAFDLQPVFELGQLDLYDLSENLPSVQMTIEKDLDGYPLIYQACTTTKSSPDLLNRTLQQCDVIFSTFYDNDTNASGIPARQVYCSGMYVNSLSYRLPINGACTETVQLVGNDKLNVSSGTVWAGKVGYAFNGQFQGGDSPASGIQRRYNVTMGSAAQGGSVWPANLPGITVVNGSGYNMDEGGRYDVHIQDVSISVSLNREDLLELGRRRPYYKYAKFPTQVSTTISFNIGGTEGSDDINANSDVLINSTNQPMRILLNDGTTFDLGVKNKLTSVTFGGGGTDGSVATQTFNYINYNNLTITSPFDLP